MNKLIISTVALVLATSAYATDLPSKKKAPAAPAPVAAAQAAASTDSLTAAYGQDLANNFGSKSDDVYQLTYKHNLGGGFAVGGMAQTTQVPGSQLNQNLEAQASYSLPAFAGVTATGKVGIGEKFSATNFSYYALYGALDYKLMDKVTWNALNYRYRSAFDTAANGYQSQQIGTGVSYDINDTYAVSAKIYRNYDTSFNATGDQAMLGLSVKF